MLLCLLAAACEPGNSTSTPGPAGDIIIASDLPTTSADRAAVLAAQQAIEFAVRQQGKIDGFTLGYWPLDDSLAANPNPVRGVENVDRMIDNRRVKGMIGPFTSAPAFYEIPEANQANLVMLSPANTNVCLTAQFCDQQRKLAPRPNSINNYFRIAAPDPLQGRAMARYLASTNPNIKRVAAFNESGHVGALIIKEFAAELARHGGELLFQQDLAEGTRDFSTFLNQAKEQGAQAIYALGQGDDIGSACLVRAQMEHFLPGAAFLGTDGVTADSHCLTDAGSNNTEGMLSTLSDVDATASKDPAIRKVVDGYRKAYPKGPAVSIFTFAAYDCARILIAAIDQAVRANHGRYPQRQQVLAAVAQMRGFKGVTGSYSFDANGDAISPLMSIWTVRNGQWVYVQKIDVRPSDT